MKTRVCRVIEQPPDVVFAVAADAARAAAWHGPGGAHLERTGRGARFRRVERVGGHEVTVVIVVTARDPPHHLAWRTEHEAFAHEADMRFLAHRRGTKVVQVDRDEWHHAPWHARLAARLALRRELRRRLALLERLVNTDRPG